ncbi:hypothetical protein RJ639_001832 [Escallonia herrerae]|uniref:GAG-pre-integrase domain-containing protein n=1 Tax=Escallonia herrerae TaxID=1293975 RepID=A0AA88XGS5_9ASTE|nr:hypothetical protein RJ639_001832 [Escallonia herrerae]
MKMRVVLIQQGLLKALKGKQGLPDTMFDDEKEDMEEKDNSKTADAGVVKDNSDGADILSVTISSSDGGWILDTGCSYHGSTVTGAAAAVAASSSDIDSDTTKLWHMRLGHMSERGMDVLSKHGLLGSNKIGKLNFCEHCAFGKQCRVKSSRVVHTTKDDDDDGSHSTEENEESQEQQYNIARNRLRREIRPPQKYGYADMVAYALSVAESIEIEKPVTYKEAVKSTKSADMMTKHIPEIKFKHCLDLISISSI